MVCMCPRGWLRPRKPSCAHTLHGSCAQAGWVLSRILTSLCPLSRVRVLMQFRMGSHSLPIEQGRLARPMIPRQLRRCTLCDTRGVGDERHYVFDCPRFAHIRRQFRSLFQDADGAMQSFMWHHNQKAVCHCLAAILNLADDSSMDTSS